MLVGMGCDVHHADHEGNTPWHSAAQSMSIDVLQKLLSYGCSVDSVNNLQCTALHYASRTGEICISNPLLSSGLHNLLINHLYNITEQCRRELKYENIS